LKTVDIVQKWLPKDISYKKKIEDEIDNVKKETKVVKEKKAVTKNKIKTADKKIKETERKVKDTKKAKDTLTDFKKKYKK